MLLLLAPLLAASAIVFLEFQNLRTIFSKISIIEIIDDINLTVLELRRYEKNIQLFNEEQNVGLFNEHLAVLRKSIQRMEIEIVSDISKLSYQALQENVDHYDAHAARLVAHVKEEQRIIEAIRPLGRSIEEAAADIKAALDLRRYEKNYLIYKEAAAVQKVYGLAGKLVTGQPALGGPVQRYLGVFGHMVTNEQEKATASASIRYYGREIEKTASELSRKKREDINRIVSRATWSFIVSFVFLIAATAYAGYIISTRILRTVRNVSRAVRSMSQGDFTYILDASAPKEIVAFNRDFNCTVRKLEEAKVELELTLEKLEETNRELVERQEEVLERRKLTAMRLLASEIAHEVSNPLSSVITYLGMLHEDIAAGDPKKADLAFMLNETTRCQALLRELVDFARKEPLHLQEVSPAKIIQDALESVRKQNNGKQINLALSLQRLPERAVLDAVLMYQVFFNLLMNAYQHTSDGDTIEVHGEAAEGMISVRVRDTGTGIPADILPSIFDPFFSTRKDTGGSGLGLAITKKIIERHRGKIEVASTPGEGTVFHIIVPVRADATW
jgi:signal transduction histidine kinase